MAEVDHMLAKWLKQNIIYLILGLVIVLVLAKKGSDIRHRFFAYLMHILTKKKNAKTEEMKRDFFSTLGSITSHDPNLRKKDAIRILEIGVGTGVNFSHYPDGCHLVVVDPNPHFAQYYNDNRTKFPNITSEEILVTTGEEMAGVEDNSVDVVVMTLVLCSVKETDQIMQQILRVLAKGGKFYFLEHIREFDEKNHGLRQKLQDVLSRTGVWPFLCDGCYLNRNPLPTIKAAGFAKVDAEEFYAPITNFFFEIIKPHLKGVAEK